LNPGKRAASATRFHEILLGYHRPVKAQATGVFRETGGLGECCIGVLEYWSDGVLVFPLVRAPEPGRVPQEFSVINFHDKNNRGMQAGRARALYYSFNALRFGGRPSPSTLRFGESICCNLGKPHIDF
jgi:hypothetical protein